MRGCPHPVLSFVVGHEGYLIGLAMRIDHVKLFVTITLPVHKGDEQHTWLRTQHIFQNPEFEVALQLVTGCVLTIAQQSRITAAGSRAAGLLEFVVSRVGEAQHQMAEVFAEFVFPGQQLQHASFRSRSSVQHEVPIAHEDRTGYLALRRREKTYGARSQVEGGNVPLQVNIADANSLAAQASSAQLLVNRIGIGSSGYLLDRGKNR